MKRTRFTEEQIVAILKQSGAGLKTAEICQQHGISETPRLQVDTVGTLDTKEKAARQS
jgi:hypothetical protein